MVFFFCLGSGTSFSRYKWSVLKTVDPRVFSLYFLDSKTSFSRYQNDFPVEVLDPKIGKSLLRIRVYFTWALYSFRVKPVS